MDLKEFNNVAHYEVIHCSDNSCIKYNYDNYYDAIERIFICFIKNTDTDNINKYTINRYIESNIHFFSQSKYGINCEQTMISNKDITEDVCNFYMKYINKSNNDYALLHGDFTPYNDVNNECSIYYKDELNPEFEKLQKEDFSKKDNKPEA